MESLRFNVMLTVGSISSMTPRNTWPSDEIFRSAQDDDVVEYAYVPKCRLRRSMLSCR
jgi:hypothetical protein